MFDESMILTDRVPERDAYWEERARRFAQRGRGLAATCSYGMPEFYNRAIDLCQRRALSPWLAVEPGSRVLDVGCGVGRWSVPLARSGAEVVGVDLAETMVVQAQQRAGRAGVAARCRFEVQDLARLDVDGHFDLILGVTVLQHVLDAELLRRSVEGLAGGLSDEGRIVLLEVAPSRRVDRCDSAVFRARSLDEYLGLFADFGLRPLAISGVDPSPLKTWYLPYYGRLPRPLAVAGLAAVTAIGLPIDLLLAGAWSDRSWHKVIVLERTRRGDA